MRRAALLGATVLALAGCASTSAASTPASSAARVTAPSISAAAPSSQGPTAASAATTSGAAGLAGMPPLIDPHDVYAADRPDLLAPQTRGDLYRVYVPNSKSDTVTVIDPARLTVLGTFRVGHEPQHVVPAYDLRTLWVNDDLGNALTPIDPRTARPGRPVAVADPYNLYFTPDGRYAVVMASKLQRLDFRDARTMALRHSVHVPCAGVNHADWTADGRFFLVSCEFSGQLLWVDTAAEKVDRVLSLPSGAMPQDVKLSPDGSTFYVADMMSNGLWRYRVGAGDTLRPAGFLPTGKGAHGLYVSRDARDLYVSNREAGTVSVLRFADDRIVATWRIPGGSPDMGNLSPDGRTLWLSGRYDREVYALDTTTGRLRARIRVGAEPHGLTVWPQPGRYSLGHTGIMR